MACGACSMRWITCTTPSLRRAAHTPFGACSQRTTRSAPAPAARQVRRMGALRGGCWVVRDSIAGRLLRAAAAGTPTAQLVENGALLARSSSACQAACWRTAGALGGKRPAFCGGCNRRSKLPLLSSGRARPDVAAGGGRRRRRAAGGCATHAPPHAFARLPIPGVRFSFELGLSPSSMLVCSQQVSCNR